MTLASPEFHSNYTRQNGPGFFARAENWLDEKGKGAWIGAIVLGFIFVWPVGLGLLAYAIWSKKMQHTCHGSRRPHMMRSSGNSAFDAYKADTLRRLSEEQQNFQDFLQRLRDAKDKAEFDQFMDEREKSKEDA